jgi:hypothetical protein
MACAVQIHSWPQRVSANYLALAVLVAPLSVLETATLDKKNLATQTYGTLRNIRYRYVAKQDLLLQKLLMRISFCLNKTVKLNTTEVLLMSTSWESRVVGVVWRFYLQGSMLHSYDG